MIVQRRQREVVPEVTNAVDPPETRSRPKMSPTRHRHTLTFAAALLFGGHYLMTLGNIGKNSLRGYEETSHLLEKKTNNTIESLMATLHKKVIKKEELASLVERLEAMEEKLEAPKEHAEKQEVAILQKQLNLLNNKITTTKDMTVTKKDLEALGERLASFESKLRTHREDDSVKTNDLMALKERVETFEKKIQTHEDESVTKEDLDLLNDLIASVEKKIPNVILPDETDPAESKLTPPKLPADSRVIRAPWGDVALPEERKPTPSKLPADNNRVIKAPWGDVILPEETKQTSSKLPSDSSTVIKAPRETNRTTAKVSADNSRVIKAPWGNITLSEETKPTPSELPTSNKKRIIDVVNKGNVKQRSSPKPPAEDENGIDSSTLPVKPPILDEKEHKLLKSFNPKTAPVMGNIPANRSQPARVRMLLLKPKKGRVRVRQGPFGLVRDEMVNIVLDGLKQSPYFEALEPTLLPDHRLEPNFVLKEQDDVVWMVDARSLAGKGFNYSVEEEVLIAAKATVNYQQTLTAARRPSLKVIFVDYYDKITGSDGTCGPAREELVKLLGVGNVRDVVGKVVVGRHWEKSIGWTEQGTIWNSKFHSCYRAPTLRAAYTVRSDYVEAVERLFPKFLGENGTKPERPTPVDTLRPVDVWHHWDMEQKPERTYEYRHFSHLRCAVSEIVSSLNGKTVGGREITAVAESISEGGSIGRTEIAQEYLESLLKTKIVVVAQRDAWEDHYRLFEAFTGGAMVMTDAMLSLPDGLVDGESVVMYNSREHLRLLLLYYLHPKQDEVRLAIARKGFEVAMGRHRSHHRMEEVFFGKQLSNSLPQKNVTLSKEKDKTPSKLSTRKKRVIAVVDKGNVKQKKGTNE